MAFNFLTSYVKRDAGNTRQARFSAANKRAGEKEWTIGYGYANYETRDRKFESQ